MPLKRPSLEQLIERVEADIQAETGIVSLLKRSVLKAFAKAIAATSHTLHGFIKESSENLFPDTAEGNFLNRWAFIWGVQRRVATFAEIELEFLGTDGSTIPSGAQVQSVSGILYEAISSGSIGDVTPGELLLGFQSVESGAASNVLVGNIFTFVSPIAGINAESEVTQILKEGEDGETDEALRDRLIDRIQRPPSGGTANDYIQTALSVAGVTRAWVFPLNRGSGTVDVSFVEDDEDPIIPSAPKVDEVQEAIDAFKPVTADSQVFAPTAVEINPTIKLSPNTAQVQAAAEAELDLLLQTDAQVGGGLKDASSTYSGTILFSRLNEAVSRAAGEEDHEFVSPSANFTVNNGEIAVLGTVTWQNL